MKKANVLCVHNFFRHLQSFQSVWNEELKTMFTTQLQHNLNQNFQNCQNCRNCGIANISHNNFVTKPYKCKLSNKGFYRSITVQRITKSKNPSVLYEIKYLYPATRANICSTTITGSTSEFFIKSRSKYIKICRWPWNFDPCLKIWLIPQIHGLCMV